MLLTLFTFLRGTFSSVCESLNRIGINISIVMLNMRTF